MVKLQEVGGSYTIAIPRLMVKKKGWKKGQEFIPQFDQDGNITLVPV